jgi:hypothetical protein
VSDGDNDVKGDFQRDTELDKPGIVGARWWNRAMHDEDRKVHRRTVVLGLMAGGGALAAMGALGVGIAKLMKPEPTGLTKQNALLMQKQFGWDFGARGVPLVFDGKVEGPFVRTQLNVLPQLMAPAPANPNAKYYIPTLMESLLATPVATLPDPDDGRPAPDSAPFRRVADVLMPIVTPAMQRAYAVGEAVSRLGGWRQGLAVVVDLPGPESIAFAAGAAPTFEPVLLLDNWPHPHGVVPSHLALAALAYYQPRFQAHKERPFAAPLFVLDRGRLASYTEQSDRFDNRYYARVPKLSAMAKDGVRAVLYVVSSPRALPEPADLNPVLASGAGAPAPEAADVEVRAVALTDFSPDPTPGVERQLYGGSEATDAKFWDDYAFGKKVSPGTDAGTFSSTKEYRFMPRVVPRPAGMGMVPVVATVSGIILAGAIIDRQGSMNRFAGGWYG